VARRNLDRDARTDAGPLPHADRRRLGGVQVEAGIVIVGSAGKARGVPKQSDAELHERSVDRL
jgi:hypothetical protein